MFVLKVLVWWNKYFAARAVGGSGSRYSQQCQLPPRTGLIYDCVFETLGRRQVGPCHDVVSLNVTVVLPRCDDPIYYSSRPILPMRCTNGGWSYIPECKSDCGKLTTTQQPLSIGGVTAVRGEMPWHVGVYRKEGGQHELICGGSLVTATTVISAAHCFWNDFMVKLYPFANFAVAAGKLYRKWNDIQDSATAQQVDVIDVKIPSRFRGRQTNYQEDVAVVFLKKALTFTIDVLPICLDFDEKFNEHQLENGAVGKIAGWGFVSEEGDISPKLKAVQLPYISIERCLDETEFGFQQFITGDKICAGYNNGTAALCRGDSGGGLVFAAQEGGAERHYLRGIASTASKHQDDTKLCNSRTITAFTQIYSQRDFLKKYFIDRPKQCILPSYPSRGQYRVLGAPDAAPGHRLRLAAVSVSCDPGYEVVGDARVSCAHGRWSRAMPVCLESDLCPKGILNVTASEDYQCMDVPGDNAAHCRRKGSTTIWYCRNVKSTTIPPESQCKDANPCVPLQDCPHLHALQNKPRRTQEEFQMLREANCGYDDGVKPTVCCNTVKSNVVTTPATVVQGCATPDGQLGQCVSLYSCQYIIDMLSGTPVSEENLRFVQQSRCEDQDNQVVCCGPSPPTVPVAVSDIKDCQLSAAPPDVRTECCGRFIANVTVDKIIGGSLAAVDQYPWLALIEYGKSFKLLCGGALISSRYVLTAAHCVTGPVVQRDPPVNIRLGEYDTSHDGVDCIDLWDDGVEICNDPLVTIPIEKVIPHPQYHPANTLRRNDIALIRMTFPAPFTDFIQPICLPVNDATQNPPSNFILYAAGWGDVHIDIKLQVDLPFTDLQTCQGIYSSFKKKQLVLWEKQFCAGGVKGKDTCKGDGGGPLMFINGRVFEITGIISFGPFYTECKQNVPGVYTKVYEYVNWIRTNIQP